MPPLHEILLSGVAFVLVMSLLVAAHELGHYLFARLFNMGVEEFAIGMGKKPWKYAERTYEIPVRPGEVAEAGDVISEAMGLEGGAMARKIERIETPDGVKLRETTNFTFRPFPIGGFVRIKGMMPMENGEETKIAGGFYSKAPWQRFIVLLAGPAFSVIAGIALLVPIIMVHGMNRVDPAPKIGNVIKEGSAYVAGLRPGDKVVSIDGKPVNKFEEVLYTVQANGGNELTFVYDRDGIRGTTTVVPKLDDEPTPVLNGSMEPTGEFKRQGKIGIIPGRIRTSATFSEAFGEASYMPWKMVSMLGRMAQQPQHLEKAVGGPVSMVAATADAVRGGPWFVVELMALLSISAGIFNLLPIYPLDGGQMVVAVVEMFRRGKRLSMQLQNAVATVGFVLVMVMFISILSVDINRFMPKPKSSEPAKLEWVDKPDAP